MLKIGNTQHIERLPMAWRILGQGKDDAPQMPIKKGLSSGQIYYLLVGTDLAKSKMSLKGAIMRIFITTMLFFLVGFTYLSKSLADQPEFYGGLSYEYAQSVGATAKKNGVQNRNGDYELKARAICPQGTHFVVVCSPPAVDGGVETGYACGVSCK